MPTHAGESWLTVRITRVAAGNTNTSVVVRRRFAPRVPIHGRVELKCSTRTLCAEPEPELEPEGEPELERAVPLEAVPPAEPELDWCTGADAAVPEETPSTAC